ncbi:MAG TPA: sugar-transfer associated ATP-grasp domain-containing protein [Candidatus Paceibacterota bacterium]
MRKSDIREKIKKSRILYFTYKKITDRDYLRGYKEYLSGHNLKSKETIRKEISLIKKYWNCDPMHYYRYRLFEKELSYDELLDYVPSYYFYNYYNPGIYDNIDLSDTYSKISMHNYFIKKKIETPAHIAIIRKGIIYENSNNKIIFEELAGKLLKSNNRLFFVKPDKGRGGKGIFTIEKSDNGLYIDGKALNEKLFMDKIKYKDFVLQEGISQRIDIKKINPSSVNTLRVITQYFKNCYKISVVVLRIGRNNAFVDNSAQGGISVNLDIENGRFSKYAYTEHTNERFEKHPDTNFIFEGYVINDWDKIKLCILDFANKAFEFPEVAWDIAILDDKISVIEINTYYGIEHLQCCIGGMRRRLNVKPN